MYFRQVIYDLVEAYCNKVGELHFHHALIAFEAEPERSTNDSTFAKGSIAYALLTKIFYKTFRYLKCTAIFCNVLAHKYQV